MPERDPFINHFERRTITTHTPEGRPKKRDIFIPDEEARQWNASLLTTFDALKFLDTSHLPPSAWVDGAMPGSKALDGVLPHKDNATFYKLDIKNAFPSVDIPTLMDRVIARAEQLHLGHYVLRTIVTGIEEYATTPLAPGLPLGAPAAPYLFNFSLLQMDEHLGEMAADYGFTYTRFIDDITLSSPKPTRVFGEDTRRFIRQAIEQTPGMRVNHAKSRLLRRAEGHIPITGVAIYPDGRIQPKPELMKKIFDAFDAVEMAIFSGETITESHLGIVNGYRGTLESMSVKPYNETMRRAFRRYHQVARRVHEALDTDNYEIPVHMPASAERIAELKEYLTNVVYGAAEERTMFAYLYPEVWKAFLEAGMFNELKFEPLAPLPKRVGAPLPPPPLPLPDAVFEGDEGADGTFLF